MKNKPKPILYDAAKAAYEWLEAYSAAREREGDCECARVERENLRLALGIKPKDDNVSKSS